MHAHLVDLDLENRIYITHLAGYLYTIFFIDKMVPVRLYFGQCNINVTMVPGTIYIVHTPIYNIYYTRASILLIKHR